MVAWAIPAVVAMALGSGLSAGLQGCTVLTSELPLMLEGDGRAPTGVHYFLPKSVIDLTLSVDADNASFRLSASQPTSIPDTTQRYYLQYRPRPQYDDNVTVMLYPDKGFLRTVTANTTDQTSEVLLNFVRLASALRPGFEAAQATPERTLMKLTVDPTERGELDRAEHALNHEVREFAKAYATSRACALDKEAGIILDVHKKSLCDEYGRLRKARKPHIKILFEPIGAQANARVCGARGQHYAPIAHRSARAAPEPAGYIASPPAPKADCTTGICYRPPEAFELCIAVGPSGVRQVMLVPNKARTVEIDIQRAFFINKVQTIEFGTDGMLSSLRVKKDSELYALSYFPVAVLSAILTGLQLRVTIIEQHIGEANAEAQLIKARADLQEQRALLEAAIYAANGRSASAAGYSAVPRIVTPPAVPQSGSFLDNAKPVE